MARKDEKTFTRIGIGSIFAVGYYFINGKLEVGKFSMDMERQTSWEMRLVSMC
jgi:hypothetical protein